MRRTVEPRVDDGLERAGIEARKRSVVVIDEARVTGGKLGIDDELGQEVTDHAWSQFTVPRGARTNARGHFLSRIEKRLRLVEPSVIVEVSPDPGEQVGVPVWERISRRCVAVEACLAVAGTKPVGQGRTGNEVRPFEIAIAVSEVIHRS